MDDTNLIVEGIRTMEIYEDVLLNVRLAVNIGETKHTGVGHYRGMMAKENIMVISNSYEK